MKLLIQSHEMLTIVAAVLACRAILLRRQDGEHHVGVLPELRAKGDGRIAMLLALISGDAHRRLPS